MDIIARQERGLPEEVAAWSSYSETGVPAGRGYSNRFDVQPERSYPEEDEGNPNSIQHPNGIGEGWHDSLTNDIQPGLTLQLASSVLDRHSQQTDDLFDMDVVIQPPSRARPGRILYPPLVLRVRQREIQGISTRPFGYSSVLWVLVSLVSADENMVLAPPDPGLMTGNPVDSVHPLIPSLASRDLGFASFPGIAIRDSGEYRVRASLIRMTVSDASGSAVQESGANLLNTSSRVIRVENNVRSPVIDEADRNCLEILEQRGLRVAS
ncbi:MAG: hypothetical protein MMC33_007151 [Icmadophila ericetorum]|nr:hypothetical protein [Icmadophila ericetorum]